MSYNCLQAYKLDPEGGGSGEPPTEAEKNGIGLCVNCANAASNPNCKDEFKDEIEDPDYDPNLEVLLEESEWTHNEDAFKDDFNEEDWEDEGGWGKNPARGAASAGVGGGPSMVRKRKRRRLQQR